MELIYKAFLSGLVITLSVLGLNAQVQIDKVIELTGSGPDARLTGIEEVINPADAANKAYVDSTVANATSSSSSSGLSAEYKETSSNWTSATTLSDWEDVNVISDTVTSSGVYWVLVSYESNDGSGGTEQNQRVSAGSWLSEIATAGPWGSGFNLYTLHMLVQLSAGDIVKLQNQNDWNYCCKNTIKNVKITLVKIN